MTDLTPNKALRKVAVTLLQEKEETEGGFADQMGDKKPPPPVCQFCCAFGLALPLIIWMKGIKATDEEGNSLCGIPVKHWLMVLWISYMSDWLLQVVGTCMYDCFKGLLGLSVCANLFILGWLCYGFDLWNRDINNCRATETDPEVQQLGTFMFVWLCI